MQGWITKISGNTTQVSSDMTSGEITLGRLDRLPVFLELWNMRRKTFNITNYFLEVMFYIRWFKVEKQFQHMSKV